MLETREPDWAHVAWSVVKVLVVTTALFLASSVADRALWLFIGSSPDRTAIVYGTAARIANPDKRLLHGWSGGSWLLGRTYTLQGEPRRAGPSTGPTYYEITENVFGSVSAPFLDVPSGSVAEAIGFVEPNSGPAQKDQAKEIIDALPQTLKTVAVVEFAREMTSAQLIAFNRTHKICGGPDVSYVYDPSFADDSSDPDSMNAVVWNRDMTRHDYMPEVRYQCENEPGPALQEFRRWVGQLDEGDDLYAFELDHDWLTEAAEKGVVYGLFVDGWKLSDVRRLLDDPRVNTVYLTDVAHDISGTR
ncbi:hypothetical protein [Nonomuraea endophytica]|uniref:Uncharacterized protein n=1 Tax=Nonomuraea endophytica TaxID=714136 RepID=A0A7W8A600_9ACTN|nr:hypothetical protein [Nonomuraea endophytica]MBB5080190.1 hypothetical protein [Nonomuraea endophytica]